MRETRSSSCAKIDVDASASPGRERCPIRSAAATLYRIGGASRVGCRAGVVPAARALSIAGRAATASKIVCRDRGMYHVRQVKDLPLRAIWGAHIEFGSAMIRVYASKSAAMGSYRTA